MPFAFRLDTLPLAAEPLKNDSAAADCVGMAFVVNPAGAHRPYLRRLVLTPAGLRAVTTHERAPFAHCQRFFFQAEDGIRNFHVTGVQTCALPISAPSGIGGAPIC